MLWRVCVWLLTAGIIAGGQAARKQISLIVTNGTVVTLDASRGTIPSGAVAIDGRDIVAVGTAEEIASKFTATESVDATGSVVLPGLINTHTHAPMVLYRGLADDLALMEWLQKYIFPAEAKTVTPDFVRIGTNLAALEMIQSGTTTYVDMYYFEEEIARATKAAGMRAVLGQTIIQFPVPDAKTAADGLARASAFVSEFQNDDLITPAYAPHAMYTLDAAMLKSIRAAATRAKAPLIIHLAETRRRSADRAKTAWHLAGSIPGLARDVGSRADPRRPRGARHTGRHPYPGEAGDWRFAQPREQHEAGQRHRSCTRDANGASCGWSGHGWCRQQQRSRYVRGDAAGGVSPQAPIRGSAYDACEDRSRDGDD